MFNENSINYRSQSGHRTWTGSYYLNEGWRVVACSRRNAPPLQELASRHGERCMPVSLDVSDESSIAQLGNLSGKVELDLLINNAGISVEENCGEWTVAGFEQSFRVNAVGPALVAQALAALMRADATIVNVTSGMGSFGLHINPDNGLDAYAMSKAALNMFTLRMAGKPEFHGKIVVCMNPGWIKTDMGGDEAPGTVASVAEEMAGTIARLQPGMSGRFLSASGEVVEW
ncbi:SDR family NAD(P)-dependent oxidoreductase [Pontiella sulfatireligans]|uniref:C-factor n=1 Tax=Pontiella sulfatireligans TaxID=2750658 RepID=A0A6C2UTA1_9BACT|nr:SDR family NAD(P)-dependent oxidoreductase [Pontiella sulfatireligans]VGO23498.1 C-factor [Pontiella sulfatireligans]